MGIFFSRVEYKLFNRNQTIKETIMIAGLFSAIVTILICYFLSKVVGQVIRMQVAFWSKILFR